jgi:hypothetical protein
MQTGKETSVRLHELAFGCRIYGGLTGYDSSLTRLRTATGGDIDPYNAEHQKVLFKWLNDWGCRQFSTAHHATVAAPSLVAWATQWLATLPPVDAELQELDQTQIDGIGKAYAALRSQLAGTRTLRSGATSDVEYGPVGSAKTLFALRPNICPPWDAYTLAKLGFDQSATSYSQYMRRVLSELQGVAAQAGVEVSELPALIGRPDSTPPKLIDEYYWVTITRGFTPASREELVTWLAWADL